MKNLYKKLIFESGGKFTLYDLDRCDIKFLLELMHESSNEEVIKYADGIDYV